MKYAYLIVKVVFGLLGAVFLTIGLALLSAAGLLTGGFAQIFAQMGKENALAIVGFVFSVLGAVFLLVTVVLTAVAKRRRRQMEELRQFGRCVQGIITDVQVNHAVRVNGYSPLIAMVECTTPRGDKAMLRSDSLWHACPSTGDVVDVYFDPMDEKKYIIEFPGEA